MKSGGAYRRKNTLLFSGAALLLLGAVAGPIRSTMRLRNENTNLRQELTFVREAPRELARYKTEARALEKLFQFRGRTDVKADILATVSSSIDEHSVLLISLEEPQVHTDNTLTIETHEVILKGTFVNLLKVLFRLEKDLSSGKIVSSRFLARKSKTSTDLLMHIYIQTSRKP